MGDDKSQQIYLRWMDTGQTARLTQITEKPKDLRWSPDSRFIAFTMRVPEEKEPLAEMPDKPEGAEWAPDPRVIDHMIYRYDGEGYLEPGFDQLFVLSAEGGTPRQITSGPFDHSDPAWRPDARVLYVSANRHADHELDPLNSEIYEVTVEDGGIRELTDRQGPDSHPVVSRDGRIAYLGFNDNLQGYAITRLYVMSQDGSEKRLITTDFDRDIENPVWSKDGRGLYFQYDDEGNTRLAYADLQGRVRNLADSLGGTSLGRPYPGGSFSVAANDRFAYTQTGPDQPADVASGDRRGVRRLTNLNDDLFGHKALGNLEEFWFKSSHDQLPIHGWIVKPPDFDPAQRHPLLLEIHGGPFTNYGARFSAEIQLYAAAGYVVLYINPRGSTSYGEEFGNLIHHAYPGNDYDDLMSGVDAVIERGYVDADNLFVTGGSGGGVLSSWIVGKTDRFRAAVVAKPVTNWYSFVLTADAYNFFYKYWFAQPPWDNPAPYIERSPIALVGNVTTPTMLLTGEEDYRTPIAESEQFYQALKLREVDTALVRIPGASHGIAQRPSNLIAKVRNILGWFERYRNHGSTALE
jgi:acylaminoacyl-peptidase